MIDLHLCHDHETFKEIDDILCMELNKNLYDYIDKINSKFFTLKYTKYIDSVFNIQKYNTNIGKYVYHDDERIHPDKKNIECWLIYGIYTLEDFKC